MLILRLIRWLLFVVTITAVFGFGVFVIYKSSTRKPTLPPETPPDARRGGRGCGADWYTVRQGRGEGSAGHVQGEAMNDGDGLYRAILEDPLDQVVKGVYADWLDETAGRVACPNKGKGCTQPAYNCPACHGSGYVSDGRSERAKLIRLQIELSHTAEAVADDIADYVAKKTRAEQLLLAWGERWALETVAAHLQPGGPRRWLRWDGLYDNSMPTYAAYYGARSGPAPIPIVTWKWMDGFVAEVELSGDDWVRYAAKLWWHPEWRFGNDAYEGGRVSYQPYNPQASPLRRVVLKSYALRDHQRPGTYPEIQNRMRMDYKPLQFTFPGESRNA